MRFRDVGVGFCAAIAARALVPQLLSWKFGRDVRRLNQGDYSSLLAAYGQDAVLHFNEGDHRWSGDWKGRAGIERFLQNFTAAGIQGTLRQVTFSGPPWDMTLWARFDDHAASADGTRIYENRDVLVLRARWGKIVEQDDFYADTVRISTFDKRLTELGIRPID